MSLVQQNWRDSLDQAAELAGASKWRRLLYAPARYLCATTFRHIIYPLAGKPWKQRCRTFFDAEMYVALPASMDLFLLGCKTHDSELRLARFFLHFIRPGDVIADVGAHFGFFTLLSAALSGEHGRVFAFEPGEANFALLQLNVSTFHQVEAQRFLVGAEEGKLAFWEFPTLYSEYNTTNPDAVPAHLKGHRAELPCISLDLFFARMALSPRLVKIDVEGAEWQVLQGMKQLLQSNTPPVLAMEYLPDESHRRAVELLYAWGFTSHVPGADGIIRPCADLEGYMRQRGLDSENFVFVKE